MINHFKQCIIRHSSLILLLSILWLTFKMFSNKYYYSVSIKKKEKYVFKKKALLHHNI